ncbi:MAG: oxidoreductase, partial [Candidatus Eisenbacteria bacterium]|nr:oxidoreductase [Candidatus Eisenbacteria bacterium]
TLPPWQGRKSLGPSHPLGWEIVAPSALPAEPTSQVPREMTRDDIRAMVDAFAQSTRRAARAGFDVVELHGAHGYLLHQFLSPISNRRTDEYGGSLENRMRFTLEVFDAARAEFPADRPLGIRVSASDWVEGGWTPDETVELARVLAARGCDFIDVSSGGLSPDQKMTVGPGYQVPLAAKVRAATGMVTMAVG